MTTPEAPTLTRPTPEASTQALEGPQGHQMAAVGESQTASGPNLPHSHSRCGKRWSGARTAHCGACCVTTTGETAFRAHRRDGHCVDPATVGLVLIPGRAYRVWGTTGGESDAEAVS